MSLETELAQMIAKELSVDEQEVVAEAHLQDDLGADSLMLVELAEGISARYEVTIDPDDLVDIANVGELIELVRGRIEGS
jgi:acyl carrier protein